MAESGENTGTRGSLHPSEEFTGLYQVNPINNKRLLNMKSRAWGTPDGSAVPSDTSHSPWGEETQRAISADGVPDGFTICEPPMPRKGAPPFLRVGSLRGKGGGAEACVSAGGAKIFPSAVCRGWRKG